MQPQAASFNTVAHQYASVRPGYPQALFDFVVDRCGLHPADRLLEVGTGTGQATRGFVGRGFQILGLEPGAALAQGARRALAAFPEVQIEEATLERWEPAGRKFSLLFSAQAFHWVDPEIGLQKPPAVLERGAHLALFWNLPLRVESPLRASIDRAYEAHAPALAWKGHGSSTGAVDEVIGRFDASSHYARVAFQAFPWTTRYETDQYVQLLGTFSDHIALPRGQRAALLEQVREAIASAGGTIESAYEAQCFLFGLK